MAKSQQAILKKGKDRRKNLLQANKDLKLKKNWYSTSDVKEHFSRKCKAPKASHIQKKLTPGQIVIILSGRFRGRRVVYLKRLESGLLLVTGPYKYNGVPLKRVNQAYVLPTSTKVDISANVADSIKDDLFTKVTVERKSEKDFFEEPAKKKERITKERKDAQTSIDTAVKKSVDAVPMLKEYLKARFALKNGDKPHLMKF